MSVSTFYPTASILTIEIKSAPKINIERWFEKWKNKVSPGDLSDYSDSFIHPGTNRERENEKQNITTTSNKSAYDVLELKPRVTSATAPERK